MKHKLTQQDVDKMKAEIEHRKVEVRPELLEHVKEARAHGDLSENFEYHASVRKGEEAVDMIHRKNTQKKDETSHAYIMRLEYEPQLIVRKSTGRKF
mgnify:CR=1 FL=1